MNTLFFKLTRNSYVLLSIYGIVWFVCPASAFAQKKTSYLHLILAADTKTNPLKDAASSSIARMEELMQGVAETMSTDKETFELNPKLVIGDQFSLQGLNNAINSLATKQNDIIVFYSFSHGSLPEDDKFPTLHLHGSKVRSKLLFDKLKLKDHRTLLVMVEACNHKQAKDKGNGAARKGEGSKARMDKKTIDALFKTGQNLIISSASPGEKSHFTLPLGGFFNHAIVNVIKNAKNADWPGIMSDVQEEVNRELTRRNLKQKQTPFIETGY